MSSLNRRLCIEFGVFLVLLAGLLSWRIPEVVARQMTAYAFFDPLVDMRDKIARFYVLEPDQQEMLEGSLRGMLTTLDDPYTNYFTPKQLAGFEKSTTGTFTGIGAEIEVRDQQLRIVTPLEDSPAFKAGIMAGDAVLEINGETTDDITVTEAVEKITGPEGTDVTLKVRHPNGEEAEITITRAKIEIETVRGFERLSDGHWRYMLNEEAKVGYIRLAQFSEPTYEKLVSAIEELQEQGMQALILDLRYNPGGLLDSAIRISDLFLEEGVIVSTKGRDGARQRVVEATKPDTLESFPLVVLVNEASASASEIVSGALKDNGRAIIVGTRTVGKGSVQELMKLDGEAGAVKLTTSYYYLPSGRNINRRDDSEVWGVDPTDGYYVPMTVKQREEMIKVRRESNIIKAENGESSPKQPATPDWLRETRHDHQLAAALETILAKQASGEFVKVGKDNATVLAHITEREALQRRKTMYEDRIEKIDEEIERLTTLITSPEDASPSENDTKANLDDAAIPPAKVPADAEAPAEEVAP